MDNKERKKEAKKERTLLLLFILFFKPNYYWNNYKGAAPAPNKMMFGHKKEIGTVLFGGKTGRFSFTRPSPSLMLQICNLNR
ncbi:MAG TPA: hypothetical protein ENH23_05290 [candidate division Zixibacteria bacterium]|nr:hypothetical protein [candidate division Zixibacteria bacterium]